MNRKLILCAGLLLNLSCNQAGNKKNEEVTTEPTEKNACILSQITYCKDVRAAVIKHMPGWQVIWEGTELEGNFAFVASNGKDVGLAIRGSLIDFNWSAFQNWIYQDLQVVSQNKWLYTLVPANAKISQGTYEGWTNLCKMKDKSTGRDLLELLRKELNNDSHLLITGHSLGGNLATVYASYLFQELKKAGVEINVVSFGAPAAGNEGFAGDFNKKFPSCIRVENANDIVPKFPLSSGISSLGGLYNDSLSAGKIHVGYKDLSVSLSTVFTLINTSLGVLELTGTLSPYQQTGGVGKKINFPLSGKNNGTDILNWMAEAAYQHRIENYAIIENLTPVQCTQ